MVNAPPAGICGTKSLALLNRLRRLALREFNRARNERLIFDEEEPGVRKRKDDRMSKKSEQEIP